MRLSTRFQCGILAAFLMLGSSGCGDPSENQTSHNNESQESHGDDWNVLKVGVRDRVYYKGDVTADDAAVLGELLQANGTFSENGDSVWFAKDAGEATMSFVVKDGAWNDGDAVGGAREMVKTMAPKIGGLPITLRLLNSQMESKREIKVFTPTMKELLTLINKNVSRPSESVTPELFTFDYGVRPNCWKVIAGEPDSISPNEAISGHVLDWEYKCSDGAVVFSVYDPLGSDVPNTVLATRQFPNTP